MLLVQAPESIRNLKQTYDGECACLCHLFRRSSLFISSELRRSVYSMAIVIVCSETLCARIVAWASKAAVLLAHSFWIIYPHHNPCLTIPGTSRFRRCSRSGIIPVYSSRMPFVRREKCRRKVYVIDYETSSSIFAISWLHHWFWLSPSGVVHALLPVAIQYDSSSGGRRESSRVQRLLDEGIKMSTQPINNYPEWVSIVPFWIAVFLSHATTVSAKYL